jgi:hypothetical protein
MMIVLLGISGGLTGAGLVQLVAANFSRNPRERTLRRKAGAILIVVGLILLAVWLVIR